MVVVITYFDREANKELVSHGVDLETNQTVILPPCTPQECGARWNPTMREWVL